MDTTFFLVDMLPSWFWALTAALFGLAIGSFLNVVIYRLPFMLDFEDDEEEGQGEAESYQQMLAKKGKKMTLFSHSRSVCPTPGCEHQITALENIPVISYIFLGGKCSNCKSPISLRYPFVEALTAFCFMLCYYKQASLPTFSIAEMITDAIFIAANIVLIFIDYDHMILPNVITYPGAALALTARLWIPNPTTSETSFYAVHFSTVLVTMLVLLLLMRLLGHIQPFKLGMLIFIAGVVSFFAYRVMSNPEGFFEYFFGIQMSFGVYWSEHISPYPWVGSLINGTLGAIIGAGILLTLREAYYVLRGIEGMGLGDIKMMLMVGFYLGWQQTIANLVIAALLGSVIAGLLIVMKLMEGKKPQPVTDNGDKVALSEEIKPASVRDKVDEAMQTRIPFGVFLGAASIILTIFGNEILRWYINRLIEQ